MSCPLCTRGVDGSRFQPDVFFCVCVIAVRPLDVRITSLKRPLSAGRKVELSCQSSGGRPPPQISWWLGKKKLSFVRDNVTVNDNYTTSNIAFSPSLDYHGKYLACRADNPLLSNSGLEDGWTLNIQCECHSCHFLVIRDVLGLFSDK